MLCLLTILHQNLPFLFSFVRDRIQSGNYLLFQMVGLNFQLKTVFVDFLHILKRLIFEFFDWIFIGPSFVRFFLLIDCALFSGDLPNPH